MSQVLTMPTDESNEEPVGKPHSALAAARERGLKITLISLHGLIRARDPELGRDADTGGQVRYVLELAKELAAMAHVREVELLTRQIIDPSVGEDYAQLEEPISAKARIVRIPFGPKRYLKKESLWHYLEMFVDQVLPHFRRTGIPDIIHGHYADAGLAGAQLASLLHVPFVFTGHSLGRVKRRRLSLGRTDTDQLERRYRFATRIEAEEQALETAAMIVTSTHQEVEEQYAIYDHYVPSRMEVIPPGVDLDRFSPARPGDPLPPIADELARFLSDPSKPAILAMARPDERKNLAALVRTYGQSERLKELANLVLVLGNRDDLRELPGPQRSVIEEILLLIDRFDLYGKVAYPKRHRADDVPDLYRWAAATGGVFVNPALTEPFGLTLLEAGASGLPIVATRDGGPTDIIANCRNGLLIDPFDDDDLERALVRILTDPAERERMAEEGIRGTREHYSWRQHARRYLRDLEDILDHSPAPTLASRTPVRRLPDFDRLIITDLDNTLTGDDRSLEALIDLLRGHERVGFGIATGRRLDSALALIDRLHLPRPDLLATDVGTQLHYGERLTPDRSWRQEIGYAWKPAAIRELLDSLPGLRPQEDEHQSEFKISYELDRASGLTVATIRKRLREAGLRAKVVLSLETFLDVIPVRGGSDMTLRHLLWKWGLPPEHVLVAGDSGNDAGMLLGRTLGVVVANHGPELDKLRDRPRVYFAQASHAAGILEGIRHYRFLDEIAIPDDRLE
ncbi:MAG TPA: HAD-IIB family hydrolase [Pirellulaceae bacterium]|nr:HAD-IIB family hydrolase [Pirellulaceae bacterium]